MNLKWIDSIKRADLDINETTIVFEYPDQYYLDLELKYKCDSEQGTAKFDKTKRQLVIKLPVVGLTEDSQKVMDDHYQKFVVEQQERIKQLELQGEAGKSGEKAEDGGEKTKEEEEMHQAALDQLESMASKDGVGSKVLKTSPLIGGDSEVLQDEYNLERDTEHLKQDLFADNDDEDDVQGDGGSRKQERAGADFLKVYKK